MKTEQEIIEDFLEFSRDHRINPRSRTSLMVVQIENHPSNDYWREISFDEQDQLVEDFLESRKEDRQEQIFMV